MTFGGAACPSEWSNVSEIVTDLASILLNDVNWDPTKLCSPVTKHIPTTKYLPNHIPLAQSLPTLVNPETPPKGICDVYIDDIATVTVDEGENARRAKEAVPLAIHALGRPQADKEHLPRDNLVSISKLAAEGTPAEEIVMLGFSLNTRSLTVALPEHKFVAWTDSIKSITKKGSATHDELDTLVGRLTHLSAIVLPILHFLSRLRQVRDRAKNRREIRIPAAVGEDLELMQETLLLARRGINMNLLTYHLPSHVYRSDACPAGIGGYSSKGRVWRFKIPPELQFRATLNFLEWIGCQIGPLIDLEERNLPPLSCILSMTDNSTAAGWLRKSNFREETENDIQLRLKRETARHIAITMMRNELKLYSQWFPGEKNEVADSLSRDFHIPHAKLTTLLKSTAPQ